MDDAVDGGLGDAVSLCDLAETEAAAVIAENGLAVELERTAPDVPAFEPGAPHAGAHTLDDEVALEFGDRADDDHDGPAQRAGRIDRLTERDELDVETVELVEDLEQMFGRACDAITSPDQDDIEAAPAGIAHQVTETWPAGLHAADPVGVLLDDLEAALGSHLTQVMNLSLGVLIDRADSEVQDGPFHWRCPLGEFLTT